MTRVGVERFIGVALHDGRALAALGLVTVVALLGATLAEAVAPGTYRGQTSQERRATLTVKGGNRFDFNIAVRQRCEGEGTVNGVIRNARTARLRADGSFSYTERGRATIEGLGRGPYRIALGGRVTRRRASGHFTLRQSAGGVTCRSGRVTFRARRH